MIRSGTYEEAPEPEVPPPAAEPAAPAPDTPPAPPPAPPDPAQPAVPSQPKPPPPIGLQPKKLNAVLSKMNYGVSEERTGANLQTQPNPERPVESSPSEAPAPAPAVPVAKPARKFRAATARAPLSTPAAVRGEAVDPAGIGPAADGSCPAAKPWKSPKTGNCYQTNLVCGATGGVTCGFRGPKGP